MLCGLTNNNNFMPGYRILKRKKNEIEYLTEEENTRYYKRIITINIILVVGLLLALILI